MMSKADGRFKVFLILSFSTGIRTGEAMGLKWSDINFKDGYIDLQRSISKGVTTNGNAKTKNHKRFIELLQNTKNALLEYYKNRRHNKWVFVSKNNKPFKESKTISDYYLKPLLFKHNIEYKTLYATRHTFTSIFLNSGANESWIKNMLGHTQSSKITKDVYFNYESDKKYIKKANNIFVSFTNIKQAI